MITSGGARILLTALFAILGAWYLAKAARALRLDGRERAGQAAGSVLHVLMSAAMIAMAWPWGAAVPVIAQVTVFTAAAGWFAGQAVFGTGVHHGYGTYGNWYHAGMMAAMVWMAVAMPLMAPLSAAGGTGTSMAGGDMAGMDMNGSAAPASGQLAAGGGTATGTTAGGLAPPGWAGTVCAVLAALFLAAAAWQAIAALRPFASPRQDRTAGPPGLGSNEHGLDGTVLRDGSGALMAAGMAVALLAMT